MRVIILTNLLLLLSCCPLFAQNQGQNSDLELLGKSEEMTVYNVITGVRDKKGELAFHEPTFLEFHDDSFIVLDRRSKKVSRISLDGKLINVWGGKGNAKGNFDSPQAMTVSELGNIYIGDSGRRYIDVFDLSGKHIRRMADLYGILWNISVDSSESLHISKPDLIPSMRSTEIFLFNVLNNKGNLVFRCPEKGFLGHYPEHELPGFHPVVFVEKRKLLVSTCYPLMIFFDERGNILERKIIEDPRLTRPWDETRKSKGLIEYPYEPIRWKYRKIRFYKGYLYALSWIKTSGAEILKVDLDGEIVQSWYFNEEAYTNTRMRTFDVYEDDGELRFAISVSAPKAEILVLIPLDEMKSNNEVEK